MKALARSREGSLAVGKSHDMLALFGLGLLEHAKKRKKEEEDIYKRYFWLGNQP